MASELKTNLITPASSTTVTIGGVGDTISCGGTASGFGGGKIIQVVSTTKNDVFSSSTGSAWTDITGMTVTTATLASTSSKVLVVLSIGDITNYTGHAGVKIVDGSGSDITDFIGDAGSSRTRATSGSFYSNAHGGGVGHHITMTVLDATTGSTTARTYKVQFHQAGGGTLYMNRSHNDSDNSQNYRGMSTITAMEIGA
jgi:hypothetical protein